MPFRSSAGITLKCALYKHPVVLGAGDARALSPKIETTMIEEIESLPTYAKQDVVAQWLKRVMEGFDAGLIDRLEMIDCLYELADQQWHQYELFPDANCIQVEQWVLSVMDLSKRADAEMLVRLAHGLGFRRVTVRQFAKKVIFEDLRDEFHDILKKFVGERVDPYHSLR
jgi:hypothetical protein